MSSDTERDELPGFLIHSTGLSLEHRVDTPDEAAAIVRAHRDLGLPGAIVLAQPVPADHALDADVLQAALDDALHKPRCGESQENRSHHSCLTRSGGPPMGKACGPIALLVSNARLAAEVAVLLSDAMGKTS